MSKSFSFLIGAAVAAALVLLCSIVVEPAEVGQTGVLKLKVIRCLTPQWISGASVNVAIIRSGVGQVDSGSGTTDSQGYVEITFSVSVRPSHVVPEPRA
jgi:hypothetical protein